MFSVSRILCDYQQPNDHLRYGHRKPQGHSGAPSGGGGGGNSGGEAHATPKPVVVWAVTRACNLRCVHCYASADASPLPNELTTAEGLTLLDDLKAFGVPAVLFSGGEPLARPDTLELIRHAVSLHLPATLSTNGTLITHRIADKLARIGLRYVGISLDGARDQHDKLRGKRGAFDNAMHGIQLCKQAGLRVGVRFTVHALNQHHLEDIFALCTEQGIDRLCVYHLAYAGRGGNLQRVDLTSAETRDVIDRIFHLTRRAHDAGMDMEVLTVGNHADNAYAILHAEREDPQKAAEMWDLLTRNGGNRSGSNICSIDPVGNVHYDQFSWHYTVGNIRHATFREVWAEPSDVRLRVLRDRAEHLPAKCQACRFLPLCNGNLRTRAEAATGDWLGMDPSCYLTDDEVGAVGTSYLQPQMNAD